MSNQLNTENNSQTSVKNKSHRTTRGIVAGCIGIALGLITLSVTVAIANLAKEQLIKSGTQSINTFLAFKNGEISYETFKYISEGRGETPSSLESLMLISAQRERGDLSGRDRTLMRTLKGDNSIEIYQVLGSSREIFDEKYRNDQNALNKKVLSENLYNKIVELQKTTLNENELSALKKCSDDLLEKQNLPYMLLEMLLPRKHQCPEAVEIADNFLNKKNDLQLK